VSSIVAVNRILAGTSHLLCDERIELVLERIYTDAQVASDRSNAAWTPADGLSDDVLGDFGFSLRPAQGEFMYLLCRSLGASTVLDFATSAGASAIYLAAALRDNGGGRVISADWRPERVAAATANIEAAGLSDFVEIRCGDPADVLAEVPAPVDFVWVDGWPQLSAPSRALAVLERIAPVLRPGAMLLNDAREPDYIAYTRDNTHGFRTSLLDIGVLSVRLDGGKPPRA
jgi:predicted O-methyltransferase YrrM